MENITTPFKKSAQKIGLGLIILLAAYKVRSFIVPAFQELLNSLLPDTAANTIFELFSGALYFAVFMLAALFIRRSLKTDHEVRYEGEKWTKTKALLFIFPSLALILLSAYFNSLFVSQFKLSEYMQELLLPTAPMSVLDVAVEILTLAIVPAVCEEFLFRATVLNSLLPYGERTALISSALLFGLVHQNPAQLFYATMAGLIIGYVYIKTRSFLCVFFMHFLNNLLSVIQTVLFANLSDIDASLIFILIELMMLTIAVICVIILVISRMISTTSRSCGRYKRRSLQAKVENTTAEAEIPGEKYGYSVGKFFITKSVLIFTIICVLESFYLLLAVELFT